MMIIPPAKIAAETLRHICEAFITREGTDYGEIEVSLEDKTAALLPQIACGEVLICYDEHSETITLCRKQDMPHLQS